MGHSRPNRKKARSCGRWLEEKNEKKVEPGCCVVRARVKQIEILQRFNGETVPKLGFTWASSSHSLNSPCWKSCQRSLRFLLCALKTPPSPQKGREGSTGRVMEERSDSKVSTPDRFQSSQLMTPAFLLDASHVAL